LARPYTPDLINQLMPLRQQIPLVLRTWRIDTAHDLLRLRDLIRASPVATLPPTISTQFIYPTVSAVCIDHTRIHPSPFPDTVTPSGQDDLTLTCEDGSWVTLTRDQLRDILRRVSITTLTVDIGTAHIQPFYLWDAYVSYGTHFWVKGQRLFMAAQRQIAGPAPPTPGSPLDRVDNLFARLNPHYVPLVEFVDTAARTRVDLDGFITTLNNRALSICALRLVVLFYEVTAADDLRQLRNIAAVAHCLAPPHMPHPATLAAGIHGIFDGGFPTHLGVVSTSPHVTGAISEDTFIIEGHQPTTRGDIAAQIDTETPIIMGFPREIIIRAFVTFGYRFCEIGDGLVEVDSLFPRDERNPRQPTLVPISERRPSPVANLRGPIAPAPPEIAFRRGRPILSALFQGSPPPAYTHATQRLEAFIAAIRAIELSGDFATPPPQLPLDDVLAAITELTPDLVDYMTVFAFHVSVWSVKEIPIFRTLAAKSPRAAEIILAWCKRARLRTMLQVLFLARLIAVLHDLEIICIVDLPLSVPEPIRHAYVVIRSQYIADPYMGAITKCLDAFSPTTTECYNAVEDTMCPLHTAAADSEQVFFYTAPTNIECQDKTMLARRVDGSLATPTDYIGVGLLNINVLHVVEAIVTLRQIFYTRQVAPGKTDLLC